MSIGINIDDSGLYNNDSLSRADVRNKEKDDKIESLQKENKELIQFIINIGYKKQLDIELELQKKGQSNYRKSKKQ